MATDGDLRELLSREYIRLQQTVEDFDSKALTIKAWSVTFSAAAIIAAYVERVPVALIVASGSAVVFWMIEAIWKVHQQAFYQRLKDIERYFAEPTRTIVPFQISEGWNRSWNHRGRSNYALTVMWWSSVFLPHAVVAVASLALYFALAPVVVGD